MGDGRKEGRKKLGGNRPGVKYCFADYSAARLLTARPIFDRLGIPHSDEGAEVPLYSFTVGGGRYSEHLTPRRNPVARARAAPRHPARCPALRLAAMFPVVNHGDCFVSGSMYSFPPYNSPQAL